jgi:hypothetical protein
MIDADDTPISNRRESSAICSSRPGGSASSVVVDRALLAEAVALLFVPAVMLVCAFPTLVLMFLTAAFPAGDASARLDLLSGLLPYPAAAFGLCFAWRHARALAHGECPRIGWTVLAVVAGGFATWEVATTTDDLFGVLTCAPPWMLAFHLAWLRLAAVRRAGRARS